MTILEEYPFALCLTHDVDRVYKTYQTLYYAVADREPRHLLDLLPGRNPYWQFEEIMALESELGVRSAFYILDEQNLFRDKPPRAWIDPENWKLYAGRYSLDEPSIADALAALDNGGWEIGLHGSYDSYRDPDLLRREKRAVESVVDQRVLGGRQHYLNLERPATWRYHADVGLRYDATLGSTEGFGFQHGYRPLRPFDDEFVVFPLTLMEMTLPDVADDPATAWCHCLSLLEEARANGAVMTVLWHPTHFSERDHPNYETLYRRLIERAQEMGAWVGPPGELYRSLEHPTDAAAEGRDRTVAAGVGDADRAGGRVTAHRLDGEETAAVANGGPESGRPEHGGGPAANGDEPPGEHTNRGVATAESEPPADEALPAAGEASADDAAAVETTTPPEDD